MFGFSKYIINCFSFGYLRLLHGFIRVLDGNSFVSAPNTVLGNTPVILSFGNVDSPLVGHRSNVNIPCVLHGVCDDGDLRRASGSPFVRGSIGRDFLVPSETDRRETDQEHEVDPVSLRV